MSIKAETRFALKDKLFNKKSVGKLSTGIARAYSGFKQEAFERDVLARFPQLDLKERINWIVTTLEYYLPDQFHDAQDVLRRALPEPLDSSKTDDDFGEFIWIVPGEFVARHGCSREHIAVSLDFLRDATKRFSSEAAIRPFLRAFPAETMTFVHECVADNNYHVRRLASEGIRPLLPWAQRVHLPVTEVIGVLDRLHPDKTRYVTRSVANNLNDVSKTDADLVVRTLKRWQKLNLQCSTELGWMTRHALRTLLKQDDTGALELQGYPVRPKFRISDLETTKKVILGNEFTWRCTLTSLAAQKLKITMRIHFLKANGTHSAKVFAVKEGNFDKGATVKINKGQSFKPITTRVLYPGTHYAELVVNGVTREKRAFEFTA